MPAKKSHKRPVKRKPSSGRKLHASRSNVHSAIPTNSKKHAFSWRLPVLLSGVLLIAASLSWNYHAARRLSFAPQTEIQIQPTDSISAKPSRIEIPSIHVSQNIFPTKIRRGIWEIAPEGVSYLSTSSLPGARSNIVLYAHNTKDRFAELPKMKPGDSIHLTTENGTAHTYKVHSTHTVTPDAVDIIAPTDIEVLTLYTCTGFLDSKRFVVKAYPSQASAPLSL